MQPTRIFFNANELLIDSIPQPFIAGSLIASLNNGVVQIQRPESDYLFAALPWPSVADRSGATFDSADAVMAYLAVELAKQKPAGDSFGLATPLAQDVVAGQPLAISRATGQLVLARADTYALAFVAGLAPADEAAGFALQPGRGTVTIADWSAITGAAQLSPGQPYFLAAAGGMTTAALSPGALCVARVGIAASPSTLIVDPFDPILL
ncbi:hypothetical protein [Beijerinckia sp. L45]|uniref:hypothetical protein n=1 Tax=Beijerinckia sp. L45 TaxID=1641855 RepID=UPI00131D8253|nr:hypothetical protein [Beijerinckia sp. L45]